MKTITSHTDDRAKRSTQFPANELRAMGFRVDERAEGYRWVLTSDMTNRKGETLEAIEICYCYGEGKNSLPYLWHKRGYTREILREYVGINTAVRDAEGCCWRRYQPNLKRGEYPQTGCGYVLNFDWVLAWNPENVLKITRECVRRFLACEN